MRTRETAGPHGPADPAEPRGAAGRVPVYKRVLLKLSGESFAPTDGDGIDLDTVAHIAAQIGEVHRLGVEIGIVVGGGNIFRGSAGSRYGMDRVTADNIGMLATVINGLALRDSLERAGVETRVQTAILMQQVAEPFIRGRALRHLEKGRVVIFAAGTGNPYMTTDTPAALRALEVGAEAILMGKRVKGVFTEDPLVNPDAEFLPDLTYMEVLERNLKVMDATAIALCKDHHLPILVFDLLGDGNIERVVLGEQIGTIVH